MGMKCIQWYTVQKVVVRVLLVPPVNYAYARHLTLAVAYESLEVMWLVS